MALDHQRRRKALADFAEHERAMSKFCAISSSKAQNLDTGYPEVETAPVRRCGIWRMGRYRGTESLAYHLRCGRRGCVDCRPRVIAAKVAAVPAVDLYAIEVAAAQWPALAKRLSRARKGETAGEYVRIPRADDLVLVVSDAPIGRPIDRAVVADIMESTPTAHGYITASPAWRVRDAQVLDADDGFVDEGRMTSRPEWLRDVAERRLGRPVRWNRERGRMEFGETTDDEHHMLKFAGQVMSDDECRKAEQGFITGRRLAEQAMSGRRAAA